MSPKRILNIDLFYLPSAQFFLQILENKNFFQILG